MLADPFELLIVTFCPITKVDLILKKIIFRADGGPAIGMGHFIRTLALAEMLKDDFYCVYATQSPTTYQISEIEKVCHERIDLPIDNSHFTFFLNLLKGDEIVVLDNYYFTTEYQKAIKEKGCKLVCIDDLHDKHFVADIIINHAEGIDAAAYSCEKYTRLLLGYQFALLRNEYLSEVTSLTSELYSCLVMMGGSDPDNITTKVISFLMSFNFSAPIAVVVGDSFAHDVQLSKFRNTRLFKGVSSSQVYQIMQQSYFGILPASTVAIEACAARLPFICGYFIDNQKEMYNGIQKYDLAICVDSFQEVSGELLFSAIERINSSTIYRTIENNQVKRLDKRSKERFLEIFHKL